MGQVQRDQLNDACAGMQPSFSPVSLNFAQTAGLVSLGRETHRVARGALVAALTALRSSFEERGMSERVSIAIIGGALAGRCVVHLLCATGGDVL